MRSLRLWLCRKLCPKSHAVMPLVGQCGPVDGSFVAVRMTGAVKTGQLVAWEPDSPIGGGVVALDADTEYDWSYYGHTTPLTRPPVDLHPMGDPHDLMKSAVERDDHIQVMGESVDSDRITFDKGICYIDGQNYMDWVRGGRDDPTDA